MENVIVINVFNNWIEQTMPYGATVNHAVLEHAIEESYFKFLGYYEKDKLFRLHHIKGLGIFINGKYYSGSFFAIASDETFSGHSSSRKSILKSIQFYTNPIPEAIKLLQNSNKKLDDMITTSNSKKISYRNTLKLLHSLSAEEQYRLFRSLYSENLKFEPDGDGDKNAIDDLLMVAL